MSNIQNIIDRMEELATGVGTDSSSSVLIDSEVTAFTLFPHLLKFLVNRRVASGKGIEDVMAEHAIELNTEFIGTLPDTVLRECLEHSHLPEYRFASWLMYPQYFRQRLFENQFPYYSTKGSSFYLSEDPTVLVDTATGLTTINSVSVTLSADNTTAYAASENGQDLRIIATDPTLGVVLDAFVERFDDVSMVSCRAQALASSAASAIEFRNADNYVTLRSTADFFTTFNSATVISASIAFVAADVGRRLTIVDDITGDMRVDAIIDSITSATEAVLRGKALATFGDGRGTIQYSPVILRTPTTPALPTTITDNVDLAKNLVDDIILTGAAVLRGDIPLAQIIEGYSGGK